MNNTFKTTIMPFTDSKIILQIKTIILLIIKHVNVGIAGGKLIETGYRSI